MTTSIWRYSHLTLATSAAIFILLAACTGIILAFEPISNQLKPYAIKNAYELSVSKTIENLKAKYDEIINIEIDENDFVLASVFTKEGKNETFYINPFTAEKIGERIEKKPVMKFVANLHRSLFLKSTGRFIVGFVSFLLFLILGTGVLLIVKRQGGVRYFFSKIAKENSKRYYHIIIGRYALVPLVIITISGVYLSLEKFSFISVDKNTPILNKKSLKEALKLDPIDFELFKSIALNDIERIEFPFSNAIEDYFVLKLKDKELYVNQYTGKILSEKKEGLLALASSWSMVLHTGQGSILWSVILMLTCFSLLFFMYSGFMITVNRRNNNIKNTFGKDTAEYIILIGSETGSTFTFANVFYKALIAQGKSVFVSTLNSYSTYEKATHLVVFTSTYGDGEAPANARCFEKLIGAVFQKNRLQYSVVGFGSLEYKNFCKYAIVIDSLLQLHQNFIPNLVLHKIHNQSFESFKNWIELWGNSKILSLKVEEPVKTSSAKKATVFKVIRKSEINSDHSFLIELETTQNLKFSSGDLLSIYPKNEAKERLYSIGEINNNVLLSIRKHEFGVCSNYFSELKKNDSVLAKIKKNKEFHFPTSAKEVIMIANGTGIVPFLGMLNDDNYTQTKAHLFWGGRTTASIKIYTELIYNAYHKNRLSSMHIAYSQKDKHKNYVQDLVLSKEDIVVKTLKNGGTIMICGSVGMMNGTLEVLERITLSKLNKPLLEFKNSNQIKTDCY